MTHNLLHLLLAAASILAAAAASSTPQDTGVDKGVGGQRDAAPWVTPQWWWLSWLLSLPRRHATTASQLTDSASDEATVSVLLPLGALPPSQSTEPPRMAKRSEACREEGGRRCRRGVTPRLAGDEVRQEWNLEYVSVPQAMVNFSQQQQRAGQDICRDLSVQLFSVDLRPHYLEPLWVRDTPHLGMCPSTLQVRHLGPHVWPPSVVEARCLCQEEPCSSLGADFRCQAVKRPVKTWVRRHDHQFASVQEMVSVGCVCVQRISNDARYLAPALQS